MLTEDQIKVLIDMLVVDEGFKNYPYDDATGDIVKAPKGNITLGIGRNIASNLLSYAEAVYLCRNDILRCDKELTVFSPDYPNLDIVRKYVLLNMRFNMGTRLNGFVDFWAAMKRQDYNTAAKEMMDSKWATQVGQRANRLAKMMVTGGLP